MWIAPSGAREGRLGAAALREGDAPTAENRFQRGLAQATDPATRTALLDGLGAALYARARPEEAESAFLDAHAEAPTRAWRARTAYHAGLAAARAGHPDRALAHYRVALLYRPDFPEARRNYELLAREAPDEEPDALSPLARTLRAQADSLVAARRYAEALALLEEGLRVDTTLRAIQDYVERLRDVVTIENLEP